MPSETVKPPVSGLEITGPVTPAYTRVLTPEALAFVADLHRRFNPTRVALLKARDARQAAIARGEKPDFLAETASVRNDPSWKVAPTPADAQNRRVEITGPVERKMMINAMNSGANVLMADLEDALSPSWDNVVQGQINLMDGVRKTIEFTNPDGRQYKLNDSPALLMVRPRGWHLIEKHVLVDGEPISASLFDFGLYVFHNSAEQLSRGTGTYYYLPKMESHREARLWNDVFSSAEDTLGLKRGTIRATVLIETILAAFEMDEILYELREHALGLNAGRWDYIFSAIKKFRANMDGVFPDRAAVTMTVPFMRAYTQLLVKTCHQRGAHAIGGMAAFIPSRRDPAINEVALGKVRDDKQREVGDGFDGTWVAHPDLVPTAKAIFDEALGDRPHQKERMRDDVHATGAELIDFTISGGKVTEAGVRSNINVAIQYLAAWLGGNGAAAIFNLMEDTATAEISRSQLWQWLHRGAKLDDGRTFTPELYDQFRTEEVGKISAYPPKDVERAVDLLDQLVLPAEYIDFLTYIAYDELP